MPLALTDAQLATVTEAAALLPPAARDHFLRSVAAVLGDSEQRPSDSAVMRALCSVLAERGVAVGKQFFRGGGHHDDTATRPAHRNPARADA